MASTIWQALMPLALERPGVRLAVVERVAGGAAHAQLRPYWWRIPVHYEQTVRPNRWRHRHTISKQSGRTGGVYWYTMSKQLGRTGGVYRYTMSKQSGHAIGVYRFTLSKQSGRTGGAAYRYNMSKQSGRPGCVYRYTMSKP